MHLKTLGSEEHNRKRWEVLFDNDFAAEFRQFALEVRREIYSLIPLLQQFGPQLGRPRVDTLKGARHANLKELRFHAAGGEWRVVFAFDTERKAILLAAGDKAGVSQVKFYRTLIDLASLRLNRHLQQLAEKRKRI